MFTFIKDKYINEQLYILIYYTGLLPGICNSVFKQIQNKPTKKDMDQNDVRCYSMLRKIFV